MTLQHLHSTDSGLYHAFNAFSVAPDGKIVLAGYLKSQYPVSGYDTVGKVSWLVVLDDSFHDHHSTTGIRLIHAGTGASIAVYPNPTIGITTLELQHFKGDLKKVTYQLCDFSGRILLTGKFSSSKQSINLSNAPSGVYFIKIDYLGKVCGNVKLVKY